MSQPRINSCSGQITEHCVRAPLLCICYVIPLYCYYCCVFTISPPYSPVDPVAAADDTVAEYDYYIDDRTPTVELPGKQSHSLPQISPIFPNISCTRHCYCCCYVTILFNCIACFVTP